MANFMFNSSKILIISPHTDDGEFGCGGSINKFIEMGSEVFYVAFSIVKEGITEEYPSDILSVEVVEATNRLGIPRENLIIYDFVNRQFDKDRQKILDKLIELRNTIKPDLIFVPSSFDSHQDHVVINTECFRAFKRSAMFGYELPWNNIDFKTHMFIPLSKKNIETKLCSLRAYNSQQHRIYMDKEFIAGLAKVRGVQAGLEYAEAFEVIRCITK
jgi:N-acetylglucosamine malate deacetylase 1